MFILAVSSGNAIGHLSGLFRATVWLPVPAEPPAATLNPPHPAANGQ